MLHSTQNKSSTYKDFEIAVCKSIDTKPKKYIYVASSTTDRIFNQLIKLQQTVKNLCSSIVIVMIIYVYVYNMYLIFTQN